MLLLCVYGLLEAFCLFRALLVALGFLRASPRYLFFLLSALPWHCRGARIRGRSPETDSATHTGAGTSTRITRIRSGTLRLLLLPLV